MVHHSTENRVFPYLAIFFFFDILKQRASEFERHWTDFSLDLMPAARNDTLVFWTNLCDVAMGDYGLIVRSLFTYPSHSKLSIFRVSARFIPSFHVNCLRWSEWHCVNWAATNSRWSTNVPRYMSVETDGDYSTWSRHEPHGDQIDGSFCMHVYISSHTTWAQPFGKTAQSWAGEQ